MMHLLSFRFAPRIRDLADTKLYAPKGDRTLPALTPLSGGHLNLKSIRVHWNEILRLAASTKQGTRTASRMLRKLGSYPRQNGLAVALRELGRSERTLFILDWLQSVELRRRVHAGLDKGEARNALTRAVFFYRLGERRDRRFEQQRYRASGLNLVTAAIVSWNTVCLERAARVLQRRVPTWDESLLCATCRRWAGGSTSTSPAAASGGRIAHVHRASSARCKRLPKLSARFFPFSDAVPMRRNGSGFAWSSGCRVTAARRWPRRSARRGSSTCFPRRWKPNRRIRAATRRSSITWRGCTVYDGLAVEAAGHLAWELRQLDGRRLEHGDRAVTLCFNESVCQEKLDFAGAMAEHGAGSLYLHVRLAVGGGAVSEDTVF